MRRGTIWRSLVALTLGVGAVGALRGEGGGPTGARTVRDMAGNRVVNGVLLGIDGTNLIVGLGDAQREVVVPTGAGTTFNAPGQSAKLADLEPGWSLAITQSGGLTTHILARPGRGKPRADGPAKLVTADVPAQSRPVSTGEPGPVLRTVDGKTFEGFASFTPEGQVRLSPATAAPETLGLERVRDVRFGQAAFTRPAGPLSPWKAASIGPMDKAGNVALGISKVTITEASRGFQSRKGHDTEGFYLVYQPLVGDGQIVARVTEFQAGRAGVMIKETLELGSALAYVARVHEAIATSEFVGRRTKDQPLEHVGQSARPTLGAAWVKLVKLGDTIRGYESPDGVTWLSLGQLAVPLAGDKPVYVGVWAAAGDGALARSTFDNIQVVAAQKEAGGGWPAGVRTRQGSVVACEVGAIGEQQVSLKLAGEKEPRKVLLNELAAIVLRPLSRDTAATAAGSSGGVLLNKGELVEGEFKGLAGDQAKLSSVIFGIQSFNVRSEVAAIFLRPAAAKGYEWEVVTKDRSRWRLTGVKVDKGTLSGEEALIGKVAVGVGEVVEMHRR